MIKPATSLRPALLLDRDGVIMANRKEYVRSVDHVEIFEQALKAMARAARSDYVIIIVTNQSAVGRGLITLETAQRINYNLVHRIEKSGGRVDGVYMCPHAPEDDCPCRKPRPGLILQAAREHHLDLHRSIMIGDALTDLQAGQAAGVGTNALLRSGRGRSQAGLVEAGELSDYEIYDNLLEAVASQLTTESPFTPTTGQVE